MTMTTTQAIITIAAVVLGTMATRFIPFIIFPEGKNPPEFVKYLGTVLPYAAIGLLVIYCLKDVPASSTHGLPEAIAILFIVLIHKWKKNTLLSIGGGTVLSGNSLEPTAAIFHRFTPLYASCVWSARLYARAYFFSEKLLWLLKRLFHTSELSRNQNAICCTM